MRKQCVPGSFLPAHAQEPGNEANLNRACKDAISNLGANMTDTGIEHIGKCIGELGKL